MKKRLKNYFRKILPTLFPILFITLSSPSIVWAALMKANLYEKGSSRKTLLYQFQRDEERLDNKTVSKAIFFDPKAKEVVSEEVVLENGKISRYRVHQKQTGVESSLEVKDNKIIFNLYRDGKREQEEEELTPNLVIGPTIVSYLQQHWDQLLKGEDIEVRYAALERKETVGFKLFKLREEKQGDREILFVKMKPTSFIIAALVNPLIFAFDKKSRRLEVLLGRTLPKQRINSDWKDLDVETVYQYE